MKRRDGSLQETERYKKEVLHEAKVLNNLGDHKGLPFLLGICTDKEPYSLVIQFHGLGEENPTLHKAIKLKLLNKNRTVETLVCLCSTYNDIKTNDVLLEWSSDVFHPIIIDFGMSKPIERSAQDRKRRRVSADYIAPEVRSGSEETTASDEYSVCKMLERAVYGRSFKSLFSNIIPRATAFSCSDRPSVRGLSIELENVE